MPQQEQVTKEDIQKLIEHYQPGRICPVHPDLTKTINKIKKVQLYQKIKLDGIENTQKEHGKKLDGVKDAVLALTVKINNSPTPAVTQPSITPTITKKQVGAGFLLLSLLVGMIEFGWDVLIQWSPKIIAAFTAFLKKP